MFPLANIPVILYAVNFLVNNNVTHIVVATPNHKNLKQLQDKLSQIKEVLKSNSHPLSITYFKMEEADSLGSMLREMCELRSLKDDFIIMYSDIICNASLEGAMRLH